MAVAALTNATLLFGGINLSGYSGEFSLDYKAEMLDASVFGLTSRRKLGGLKTGAATVKAFADSVVGVEGFIEDELGQADTPLTFFPTTITAGGANQQRGYAQMVGTASMTFGGAVGALLPVNLTAESAGDVVRAVCLKDFISTANQLTGTANGTAYEIAAVTATQKVYGGLHIISVAGTDTPTITVKIQSDIAGFGSPTDRITFTAATAVGGQWATPVAGEITDTYWRATWTISGTNPVFKGLVWVAIQ